MKLLFFDERDKKSIQEIILLDFPSNDELFTLVNGYEKCTIAKNQTILAVLSLNRIQNFTQKLMLEMEVHLPISIKCNSLLILDQSIKLFGKHSDFGRKNIIGLLKLFRRRHSGFIMSYLVLHRSNMFKPFSKV